MRRMVRLCCVLAAALGLSVATGCADNADEIYIAQNQVPEEGCIVSGDLGVGRTRGQLEVTGRLGDNSNLGYLFTPVVTSNVTASGSGTLKRVMLKGAKIELVPVASEVSEAVVTALREAGFNKQQQYFATVIEPGGSVGIGFFAIDDNQALLMRELLAEGESVEVLARIRVHGEVDGNSVESDPFDYPITVCNGCSLALVGTCATLPADYIPLVGGLCSTYSDGIIECCTDEAGDPVCPAVGAMVSL